MGSFWLWAKGKYGNESELTIRHIPVHAVHMKLYLDMSWVESLEIHKEGSTKRGSEEYARAWEIVDREGYENIIEKIRTSAK